jgi:Cft2 family RNA processing exonuclease
MMTEKTLSNGFARKIVEHPEHTLIFVGYADPDSPAGHIKAAQPGDDIVLDPTHGPQKLRCHVEQFTFSGHSTRESICAYLKKNGPEKIILVHGDQPAVDWFDAELKTTLGGRCEVIKPQPGVRLEI